jgi:hypothetical protein
LRTLCGRNGRLRIWLQIRSKRASVSGRRGGPRRGVDEQGDEARLLLLEQQQQLMLLPRYEVLLLRQLRRLLGMKTLRKLVAADPKGNGEATMMVGSAWNSGNSLTAVARLYAGARASLRADVKADP